MYNGCLRHMYMIARTFLSKQYKSNNCYLRTITSGTSRQSFDVKNARFDGVYITVSEKIEDVKSFEKDLSSKELPFFMLL